VKRQAKDKEKNDDKVVTKKCDEDEGFEWAVMRREGVE